MIDQKKRFTRNKELNLKIFIDSLGFQLEKQTKPYEFWYKSPFIADQETGSFHIDTNRNVWYDFATGYNGDVTDLVARINNCSLYEALDIIDRSNGLKDIKTIPFSFHGSKQSKPKSRQLHAIKPLGNNKALTDYVCHIRFIPFEIASIYLEEIYYLEDGKDRPYFGVGIKNFENGYEISTAIKSQGKWIKTSIGQKYLTYLKASFYNPDLPLLSENITVFESFFDFLSCLAFYGIKTPNNDVIILNSNSFISEAVGFIEMYKQANLFLDNDKSGKEATKYLMENNINPHSGLSDSKDLSDIYSQEMYKDFNDFWVSKSPANKTNKI